MNAYSFASLTAFITCLLLSLFVYWKGKSSSVNKSFALVTIITGTWSLFPFVTNVASTQELSLLLGRLIYIAASLTPTLFLRFILIFVTEEKKRKEKNIIFVSYGISIFFLINLFNPLFIKNIVRLTVSNGIVAGPLYLSFISFFGIVCLYAFYKVLNAYKNTIGSKRNQLRYIFLGFGIAFISGLLHFLPAFGLVEPFPHDFLVITYSLIMAYAIVAHRLMDVNVIITKGLAYGTLTGVIAGVYVGLMAGMDRIFGGVAGYNPTMVHALLFIAVFFALIYVLPQMKIRALEITRRTLFRGKYDYQEELSEATRVIPTMFNLGQLGDYILTKIRDTMMVDKLTLFVYAEEEHIYRHLTSFGINKDAVSKIKFGENSPLAGLLRQGNEPLVKEELERQGMVPEEAMNLALAHLNALGAELCIPLMVKDDLTGIITLSNKRSGEMYTEEDLTLLATLANQVALTIEYIRAIDTIASEKRYVGLGKAAMRMAHDIKNPLVPLKTFLQILPDKYPREFKEMSKIDKEFTGRFYESALDGVDRINNLIERALHYSRHPEPHFSEIKPYRCFNSARRYCNS